MATSSRWPCTPRLARRVGAASAAVEGGDPARFGSRARGSAGGSPASTWAQLAAELTRDELITVGDAFVRGTPQTDGARGPAGSGHTTLEGLETAAERRPSKRRGKAARSAPAGSRRRASQPETDVRLAPGRRTARTRHSTTRCSMRAGELIGCTEIAYPTYRVSWRYEGDHHRTDRAQWNRDIEKHARAAAAGWSVLRLTSRHLYPGSGAAVSRCARRSSARAGGRERRRPAALADRPRCGIHSPPVGAFRRNSTGKRPDAPTNAIAKGPQWTESVAVCATSRPIAPTDLAKKPAQHSMTLTARPPSLVSLYL